jgi:hypothetical protein
MPVIELHGTIIKAVNIGDVPRDYLATIAAVRRRRVLEIAQSLRPRVVGLNGVILGEPLGKLHGMVVGSAILIEELDGTNLRSKYSSSVGKATAAEPP